MTTSEILQALPQLAPTDQLDIAETALKLIQQAGQNLPQFQHRQQMAITALSAIADYRKDAELATVTALDGVNFYIG